MYVAILAAADADDRDDAFSVHISLNMCIIFVPACRGVEMTMTGCCREEERAFLVVMMISYSSQPTTSSRKQLGETSDVHQQPTFIPSSLLLPVDCRRGWSEP
jgi:hypothetical protein